MEQHRSEQLDKFLFFGFLELLLSVSDGELKIHTCCLGGVNIAEAVKAKVAKIKIVAFILASEFKLRTNYQLFAYILSFYLNNKGRGSMFIIVYGHTHKSKPGIFFTRIFSA